MAVVVEDGLRRGELVVEATSRFGLKQEAGMNKGHAFLLRP
jgi:hypothetical protein